MDPTWLLVANGSEAKLYAFNDPKRPGLGITLLDSADHPETRLKGSDLNSDKPGSYQSSGDGAAHGSYSDTSDPKATERDRFSRELAEMLDEAQRDHRFGSLVLAAPPQMHGLLNKHLSNGVKQRVSHHIDKDYTKLDEVALSKQLKNQMLALA